MAKLEKLESLIGSIQQAFISVNRMAERQQIETVKAYFDADGKPRSIAMQTPYFDGDGAPAYKEMDVPLICIVPVNTLKLSEINVDFKVRLSSKINAKKPSTKDDIIPAFDDIEQESSTSLGYIPEYKNRDDDGYANIVLKFTADEPPEGVLKIRDEMIKILP